MAQPKVLNRKEKDKKVMKEKERRKERNNNKLNDFRMISFDIASCVVQNNTFEERYEHLLRHVDVDNFFVVSFVLVPPLFFPPDSFILILLQNER